MMKIVNVGVCAALVDGIRVFSTLKYECFAVPGTTTTGFTL